VKLKPGGAVDLLHPPTAKMGALMGLAQTIPKLNVFFLPKESKYPWISFAMLDWGAKHQEAS
jgi:hypothetical protein